MQIAKKRSFYFISNILLKKERKAKISLSGVTNVPGSGLVESSHVIVCLLCLDELCFSRPITGYVEILVVYKYIKNRLKDTEGSPLFRLLQCTKKPRGFCSQRDTNQAKVDDKKVSIQRHIALLYSSTFITEKSHGEI